MKRYKLLNNITGWVVCAIACAVYLLTIEPTASFWDCGEFIATSYKLEIGHPPGAPFFMMLGRIASLFASDPSQVAAMVNAYSAICSGVTILFLFWTITHLARRLVISDEVFRNDGDVSLGKIIAILGAGTVGALAYTFSDTFWFSAVEGEVYASSSLFTAVVYWCILKWEDVADQPYANRWLVLIAYLMGLSIGVHLLNLLSIPVLVLVYYYRKTEKPTGKGAICALIASCFILVAILYGIIPGFAEVAGQFELFFVNSLGLPYNTGTFVYALLVIGCLIYGIYVTMECRTLSDGKKTHPKYKHIISIFVLSLVLLGIPFFGKTTFSHVLLALLLIGALLFVLTHFAQKVQLQVLNTVLICCTMVLIGYSSYAALVIRSSANPTMDENSPDDVFALKSYLNREQYGDRPLFYGESYAAEFDRVESNGAWEVKTDVEEPYYAKAVKENENEPDHYVHYDDKKTYKYCKEFNMLFPRMYSRQDSHIKAYKEWGGVGDGKTVSYQLMNERKTKTGVPTFANNLLFFFKYQVGFMYWRYFMWNFVGRQNDIQGHGEVTHGNWCSGIKFIDDLLVGGDSSEMPDELKENKGHNCYYFLPLILGLLGIIYQFGKGERGMQSFWQVLIFFLLTGLAIVVYLNQTPYQPRERDYAYAGSFYAFAIWIGLGVMFFFDLAESYFAKRKTVFDESSQTVVALVSFIACLGVPTLMAQQNWDDHDRSNRYTCRDFGADYLLSLAPNAVIFTNGDNDTFPLWYNQEVEGECKDDSLKVSYQDKRVANLSYLQMGWYISQMKRDAYTSKALDLSLEEKDYMLGKLDVAYIYELTKNPMNVADAINILKDNTKQDLLKKKLRTDMSESILPTRNLYLEVDSAEAVANGGADPALVHNELLKYRKSIYDSYINSDISVEEKNKRTAALRDIKSYRLNLDLGNKRYLGKQEIFILDLLANNHWKRPVYFAVTVGSDSKMGLNRYFRLEGLAYRVMPYATGAGNDIDTDIMYDNLMRKFKFGNASDPSVYLEENNLRMCNTVRNMFTQLAAGLYERGDREKAKEVLNYAFTMLPANTIPLTRYDMSVVDLYYRLGEKDKADAFAEDLIKNSKQYIFWISGLNEHRRRSATWDLNDHRSVIARLGGLLLQHKNDELARSCETILQASSKVASEVNATIPEGFFDED